MADVRLAKPWAALAVAVMMGGAGCELLIGSDDYARFPDDAAVAIDAPLQAEGAPPEVDAAIDVIDAGAPNLGVSCGFAYCSPQAQSCCLGRCSSSTRCIARDDAGAFVCPSEVGENCGWYQLHCDDRADCVSDEVCCAVEGQTRCLRLLDCQNQVPPHAVLCDPGAAAPCPSGAACAVRDAGRPACVGL